MQARTERKRFPKFHFAKPKGEQKEGEHKGRFEQFAENVQLLRIKTHHHM